jgi:hypothetical protein
LADRTQGIFTVTYPANTASVKPDVGFGIRVRVRTSQPFAIGDFITMTLVQPASAGFLTPDIISVASASVAGASQQADLYPGWDDVNGVPSNVGLAGPTGRFDPGVNLFQDGRFRYFLADFTLIDDQTFADLFSHDPVSQAGFFALSKLWQQSADNFAALIAQGGLNTRAAHAGLTLTGAIAESNAKGAIVQATVIPLYWGGNNDTPRRYIPALGSVQFPSGTHYPERRLLHYADQIVFADNAVSSRVRYNLQPGWTATITAFDN